MFRAGFPVGNAMDRGVSQLVSNATPVTAYWNCAVDELFHSLGSNRGGLSGSDAQQRLQGYGRNTLAVDHGQLTGRRLLFDRLRSPLVLILIFAALIALLVRDWMDAAIVLGIVFITAVLSSVQEYRATRAVEKLRQRVSIKATSLRDGRYQTISAEDVVPGDVVQLTAGSMIPGDGILIEAKDFFVSQALLTGETYPVEKQPGIRPREAILVERTNCVFMGTSVRSGTATALIVHTGRNTSFGQLADSLTLRPPETEFERGLRHFGALLLRAMVIIVLTILVINIVLQHPTIETVLFAMAVAVGLSPEMLPAILTITLSRGAKTMARHGVIVKRLNAIENLGSMDVLCTDKTGTLTKGVVQLDGVLDVAGNACEQVARLAYLNSIFETGLTNPLDQAIVAMGKQAGLDITGYRKLDEIPYDFVRKRLSIVVEQEEAGMATLITKGALQNVLQTCDRVKIGESTEPLSDEYSTTIADRFAAWSEQGYRVLGIAHRVIEPAAHYTRDFEREMTFIGFLLFFDPPEPGVRTTLDALHRLGVQVKMITGDNRHVAAHVADAVGIQSSRIITGGELANMKDEALWHLAARVNLFAEVDPNQKERIITALRKTGRVVGFLGDGINDAPALHAADVGISVDNAADVAKDAADFVLLEHDLEVLRKGIDEGRHTFANTLKYIFITTSANFGNMISMAVASLFLPFLPLLAKQILLNNFFSDIPAIGIAGDNVDRDWERTPHRWDITMIRNFMLTFGLVSTVFDLLTFGVLLYLAGQVAEVFRTGWFVESLLTELCVLLVIRTRQPFYTSRPGRFLLWSTAGMVLVTLILPYSSIGALFDFVPLPAPVMAAIALITGLYLVVSEFTKRMFFQRFDKR